MARTRPIQTHNIWSLRFEEKDKPCTSWSDGYHILNAKGECRCGKKFMLVEIEQ